jgi:hypothetical protein
MASIKLGELLLKANVLQEGQLKAALAEQQKWGGKLGDILVRMSLLSEDLLIRALSKQLGIQAANLNALQSVSPAVKAKVPLQVARDLGVLPLQLREDGKTLVAAMAEPQNLQHLDTLRAVAGCRILPQLAGRAALARALARIYETEEELEDVDGSMKVVDAQGRTVVRSVPDAPPPAPAPLKLPPPRPDPGPKAVPASRPSPVETLRTLEEIQRREVAALKAVVELLIEKGVFTRDEYLAKVRQ